MCAVVDSIGLCRHFNLDLFFKTQTDLARARKPLDTWTKLSYIRVRIAGRITRHGHSLGRDDCRVLVYESDLVDPSPHNRGNGPLDITPVLSMHGNAEAADWNDLHLQ
jgi:hypothetical protein